MGGRGAGGGKRLGGGGGGGGATVLSETSLVSRREENPKYVDQFLATSRAIADDYGIVAGDLSVGKLSKGDANVMGYSDGENIGINGLYFNERIDDAYAKSVASGYHPSNGDKTAIQAVAAHEYGHNMVQQAANKLSMDRDAAAETIVTKVFGRNTDHVAKAKAISGYAKTNYNECVAESVTDVYCNGAKAHKDSIAIVKELRKYL